jgi:hypothetical protein
MFGGVCTVNAPIKCNSVAGEGCDHTKGNALNRHLSSQCKSKDIGEDGGEVVLLLQSSSIL